MAIDLGSPAVANIFSLLALAISTITALVSYNDRKNIKHQIASEYTNQLLGWHTSVIEVLAELRINAKNIEAEKKRTLLSKLSALIDQGRFYFPNLDPTGFGQHKPPAYRGRRNIALDFLVASYNLYHKEYSHKAMEQALYLQQQFTSVVFKIIRPSDRLTEIKKLTDRYFVENLSVEDLEKDQLEAVSHMWDAPK